MWESRSVKLCFGLPLIASLWGLPLVCILIWVMGMVYFTLYHVVNFTSND